MEFQERKGNIHEKRSDVVIRFIRPTRPSIFNVYKWRMSKYDRIRYPSTSPLPSKKSHPLNVAVVSKYEWNTEAGVS